MSTELTDQPASDSNATSVFEQLPCLTAEFPPIPAAIKRRYEDFRVEEIPAYEPCGEGDHIYVKIEKSGLATMRAVNDIAKALGILSRDIGLAGLKDARAVAVQTLSIEHIEPAVVESLQIPRIRILSVSRHRNKLRIGHLRGNRFFIRLRDVDLSRAGDLRAVCEVLQRRGVPNYFGQQRFGSRGDTWQIGRAVLQGDHVTAMDLMLGRAGPHDTGDVRRARRSYDAGHYEAAAKEWPYGFRDNARACRAMAKSGGKHKRAFYAVDQRLKKFFVNAYQSYLFNRVLAGRIGEIDRIRTGDLAYKHDHGAVFRVIDPGEEQPRCDAFEISPTGPIFGFKMTEPDGQTLEEERAVLHEENVRPDDFRALRDMKFHGSRRPLRFRPANLEVETGGDEHGDFLELRFTLEAGCYATMILREICKQHLAEGLEDSED